ncbi:hypothetical protein BX600DRAFT_109972 [Xylariales sp. PMI_506]|nr:hypothetical protein BX600DRAFT_109972 [Xylariales sp. PMI_506]
MNAEVTMRSFSQPNQRQTCAEPIRTHHTNIYNSPHTPKTIKNKYIKNKRKKKTSCHFPEEHAGKFAAAFSLSRGLDPAQLQHHLGVGGRAGADDGLGGKLAGAAGEAELVVAEDVAEDELELVGGEEAAGAGLGTEAEAQVLLVDGDELVLLGALVVVGVGDGAVAQLDEAVGVEGLGVGVEGRVAHCHRVRGLDGDAGGEVEAAAESHGLGDVSVEAGCKGGEKNHVSKKNNFSFL